MTAELLARATKSTETIINNVTPGQLALATPCASWSVRDVINHVVGNNHWFAAIASDGVAPDRPDNAAPDATTGDFKADYAAGAQRAVAAFAAPGALAQTLQLPWGDMPAAVFVMMASTDQFLHGWDLAKATGQTPVLDDDLAGAFLDFYRQIMADPFRGPDRQAPFGPEVAAVASASRADQLAAFLGRQP